MKDELKSVKSVRSDKKKKHVIKDVEGNKIIATEEDMKEGRASKTKITEGSDEAVCRICLCSEQEEPDRNDQGEEPNPLISPCNCAGTMGIIHFKCLRVWLETKRTKREHRG